MVFITMEGTPCQRFIDMSDEMSESFMKYTGIAHYRRLCCAVHELVINAVEAAGRQQMSGEDALSLDNTLWLRMEVEEGEVIVTITNKSAAGTAEAIHGKKSLCMEDLLLEERGRGLLIAKRWSDQLTFDQKEDGTMTIQLRKKGGDAYEQHHVRSPGKRQGYTYPLP